MRTLMFGCWAVAPAALIGLGFAVFGGGCSDTPDQIFETSGSSGSSSGMGGAGGSSSSSSSSGSVVIPPPDYDLLYDPKVVSEFTITFTAADWQVLQADKDKNKMLPMDQRDFLNVPCEVSFQGETWQNVGFRYKGNSSFNIPSDKLSFKLDFDEYTADQHIHGIKKMNFNNGFKDPSMLRECLSLEMYRNAGTWAPRCTYSRIYYDLGDGAGKQYWGVFTNVEQVDKRFLKDRFGEANADGNLYKPDGPGDALNSFNQTTFEKKTNETAADWSDVQNLISVLNGVNDAKSVEDALGPILNVDSVLRFMAINTVLTSWDSYAGTGHNYYLYNNPKNKAASGKDFWEYIVWDANEAFGNFVPMGSTSAAMISWPWNQPSAMAPKPLFVKIMMVPAWQSQYAAYMKAFLGDPKVFEPAAMKARAAEISALVSPAVHEDKRYLFPTAAPDLFTQNLTQNVMNGPMGQVLGIQPYIQDRTNFLVGSLP